MALGLQRLDDVVVRDRAEEAPIGARLLRDLQREPLELGAALLRFSERLGLRFLEVHAARFKGFEVRLGRALRLALRDEVVAGEAVLHLDDVAKLAEVGDLLHEYDLHQCRSVYVRSTRNRARLIASASWRW